MLCFEALRDPLFPGSWRVEPADYRLHGQGFVAIFSGEFAEERAVQYAYRKNQAFFVAPPHLARSA
jgi:hypothetical protein